MTHSSMIEVFPLEDEEASGGGGSTWGGDSDFRISDFRFRFEVSGFQISGGGGGAGGDVLIPFGQAEVKRAGTDCTVIAWGRGA